MINKVFSIHMLTLKPFLRLHVCKLLACRIALLTAEQRVGSLYQMWGKHVYMYTQFIFFKFYVRWCFAYMYYMRVLDHPKLEF